MCNQVSYDPRSYERNFMYAYVEAWKIRDFNGAWTLDLAIPERRLSQLSYEVTDIGSSSFVGSKEPVRNECEVIYEIFHILNCGCEIK